MRRFAGVALAAGFAAAALVPLTVAAGASSASAGSAGPFARAGGSPAAGARRGPLTARQPSRAALAAPTPTTASPPATSSPKPSRPARPTAAATLPPAKPPRPPGPRPPVRGMPHPSANCLSQRGRAHLTSEPWAQRALDFSSVWDLTQGQHVTVAVVDSGIDFTPQLAGRVTRTDLTGGNGEDCVPHGTEVASIIAASDARAKGTPFYGVAPAAHILSIRVQQQQDTGNLTVAARRKVLLDIANGIHYAVVRHAQVINVSIQVSASYRALRSAVEFALRHNVVVVAAAGNDNPGGGQGPFYPASYPGVLSVNAAGQNGQLGGFDVRGTPVSVTAPGVAVASDYPGGFDPANNGTSFAAAFVSGEAALVRAAYPKLSAAQVVHRIIATAAGGTGVHTGAGMINPVQAVTAVLPSQAAALHPASPVAVPSPRGAGSVTRTVAFSVTGGALAAAVLVAIGAVVVPQGRRRRWRPGRLGAATTPAPPAGTGPGRAPKPGRATAPRRTPTLARPAEPDPPAEPDLPAEPDPPAEPDLPAEPEPPAEPVWAAGPDQIPEPRQAPEPGWTAEPDRAAEPGQQRRLSQPAPPPSTHPATGQPSQPRPTQPRPSHPLTAAQPSTPSKRPGPSELPWLIQPATAARRPASPGQPPSARRSAAPSQNPAPIPPATPTQHPTPSQPPHDGQPPAPSQPPAAAQSPGPSGPPVATQPPGLPPVAGQPPPYGQVPGPGQAPPAATQDAAPGTPPVDAQPPAPRRPRGARHRRPRG
jgi:membrane-anchored mycosin MYCP